MLNARFLILIVALLSLARWDVRAQRPEQDCFQALSVCQTIYQQNTTYSGQGSIEELDQRPGTCLVNGENNSVWYIFTVSASGSLEFSIIPISANDDYDFSLFNLTGYSCEDISTGIAPEVRCNWAVTSGVPTGLSSSGTGTSAAANGPDFLIPLSVQVGETYVLIVDNYTTNGQGYTLDFSAGTAGIADTVAPFVDSVATLDCDTTRFIDIFFSEPVRCNSILADGSQFGIYGPQAVDVVGAVGLDCSGLQTFTTGVRLQIASPILVGGTYYFNSVSGSGSPVLDVCGRTVANDSASIVAPAIVLPHFTYGIAASCEVDTLRFINTSLPNTTNGNPIWAWDFGDMTTSTLENPTHTYPDTILYTVTLTATATDAFNCSYTMDSVIPVDRSYEAVFTYSPIEICPNEPVQFTDISPASANTWEWDFGDGNISGDQNPTHSYTAPGTYLVTLIVSEPSAFGGICSDTARQELLVLPDVSAGFDISANQICEDAPVVFTDQTTGFPSAWRWDFGNGDTSILQNPTYSYDSAGLYTITLEVSNACNLETLSRNFEVFAIPVFDLGRDTAICFDRAVTLHGFPGATMIWSTGQGGDSIVVVGAPIEVRGSATNNGCTYDDAIIIDELLEGCIIVPVPSAFTPNNDGSNDLWRLVNPQRLLSIEVWVYNRWGQVVFYDDQLNFAWDGNFKGERAEMGVYSFILKGFGESSRGKEPVYYRGNLTLVR